MYRFLKNILVSGVICASILTMGVGVSVSAEMMMGDGMMTPCPYMGMSSMCNMTPLEHLAGWQQLFTAIPGENFTVPLLSSFAISFIAFVLFSVAIRRSVSFLVPRNRYRKRKRTQLQIAFSRGILNSKAY